MGTNKCRGVVRLDSLRDFGGHRNHPSFENAADPTDLSWPWSKKPETILRDFQAFVNVVQGQLPNTWIYFVSVKPTPLRWKQWERQRRTTS
jgi:hypothetical protein